MDNKNAVWRHLAWLILSVLYIYFSARALTWSREFASRTVYVNLYFLLLLVISFLFGVFIRIPALLSRWNSNNRFDSLRFLILGVPAIFLFIQPLLFPFFPLFEWWSISANQSVILYFVGIWAGMTFLDSVKGLED